MGSDCTVTVIAPDDDVAVALVDSAVARLADLERRWSRFRDDSELTALNRAAGAAVFTSRETAAIVALAIEAWRDTAGLFDPTVHDAMVASGYDRSFELLVGADRAPGQDRGVDPEVDPGLELERRTLAAPGAGGIEVDPRIGLVVLPEGVRLDLGGIGKGRAGDLVLASLLDGGATGACVDLGGDVAVGGQAVDGTDDWVIAVDDPFEPGRDLVLLRLAVGAVTTSARTRRRWIGATGAAHHLIDPATGAPAASGLSAVTVIAGSAVAGEVHAKAVMVAGPSRGRALLESAGLCGLLVLDDGSVEVAGDLVPFLVWAAPALARGSRT
ncbi:MAG TPA: FAD:protein FMN transferase [Acidimicrobiales bacterium]